MKRTLSFILLSLVATTALMAEEVGAIWAGLQVQKTWNNGVNWYLRGEYRAKDNLSATDCYFFRTGIGYAFCPYLAAQVTYDYLTLPDPKKQQHRLLADLLAKFGRHGLTLSLRERYVMAYTMQDGSYGHVLRSMPNLSYRILESRWTPNVAVEFYNNLAPGSKFALQQYHVFAGLKCAINPINSIQLNYVFQSKLPSHKHLHTVALYYFISLP